MAQQINRLQGQPLITQAPNVSGGRPTQRSIVNDIAPFIEAFQTDNINRERQAAKDYETTLKVDVEGTAQRIILESENNAALIKKKAEGYESGFLSSVPEQFQTLARGRFRSSINLGIAKANNNLTAIRNKHSAVQDEVSQGENLALARKANTDYFSEDPGTAQAARDKDELLEFDFLQNLSEKAVDDNGNVIIPAADGKKRVDAFNQIRFESRLAGWWKSRGSTAEDLIALRDGKGPQEDTDLKLNQETGKVEIGKSIPTINRLTDPEPFLNDLQAQLKFNNDMDTKADRAADDLMSAENDVNIAVGWDALKNPESEQVPLAPQEIINQIEDGFIGGSQGLLLLKATLAPVAVTDDPSTMNMIIGKILNDEDVDTDLRTASANSQITSKTFLSLGQANVGATNRRLGITAGPRQTLVNQQSRELLRSINSQKQLVKSIFDVLLAGQGNQLGQPAPSTATETQMNVRIAEAMTQYNRRILDPEIDPVELRRELTARVRNDIVEEVLVKTSLQFLLPRFYEGTRQELISNIGTMGHAALQEVADKLKEQVALGLPEDERLAEQAILMAWSNAAGILAETLKEEDANATNSR